MDTPRLILVDGSGFIFRAYHSLPPLTRPDGTPVNAVYGFSAMLMKLLDDLRRKLTHGLKDEDTEFSGRAETGDGGQGEGGGLAGLRVLLRR